MKNKDLFVLWNISETQDLSSSPKLNYAIIRNSRVLDPILESIRSALKPSEELAAAIRSGNELSDSLSSEKAALEAMEFDLMEAEASALDGSPLKMFSGSISDWIPGWNQGACGISGPVIKFLMRVGILTE